MIFIRPGARDILSQLSKIAEIIVFTASHKGYADKVIDLLDPEGTLVSHRLFREHCFKSKQGVYVKDLRILGRPLDQVLIVDNAMYSFALQLTNGVPIIPYSDSPDDGELFSLSEFISKLLSVNASDLRVLLNEYFQYEVIGRAKDLDECFNLMFQTSG